MAVKKTIKKLMPSKLWRFLHNARIFADVVPRQINYRRVLRRIKKKDGVINIVFIAAYYSVWKYESLYRALEKDARFKPIVLICPVVRDGIDAIKTMTDNYYLFQQDGYDVISAYNEENGSYSDAHDLEPDIIFFTTPYKELLGSRYAYTSFHDSLLCFVNYSYTNHTHEWGFNLPFHQALWRFYVESEDNYALIKRHSLIHGRNLVVSGYPMYDAFCEERKKERKKEEESDKLWKIPDRHLKRIIWSPHHSISNGSGLLAWSTFEQYYDFMLYVADKYKESIQIVFKPHPMLKSNLYRCEKWGKDKTDAYWKQWEEGSNTAVVEGNYVELFKSSDAIINDSGSFIMEYLYVNKPCLNLDSQGRRDDANEVALKAYACWYNATDRAAIEHFITSVVIKGEDCLKQSREDFYNNVLVPPGGITVAGNIMKDIKTALGWMN